MTGPGTMRRGPALPDTSDEEEEAGKSGKGSKQVADLSSGEEAWF